MDTLFCSCCLFQNKVYICTACVKTTKFRGKGLQVGNAGSAGHPKAYLPSGKLRPEHNRPDSHPSWQPNCKDEDCNLIFLCSENRCLAWKVALLPFSFYWNHWWCHVWDCASHWGVTQVLPHCGTGHTELLFYNRIIRTDSAPVILSPITVAFGLLSGLSYRIVLLTLPSTAPWFVNWVTDRSLGAVPTAVL